MRAGSGGFQMPQMQTVASRLAVAVGVVSLACMLVPGLVGWVALVPDRVLSHFAFWQLVTYPFVAGDVLGLLFGVMTIWSVGGMMERTWGPRRLLTFCFAMAALSGALTLLLAFALPGLRYSLIPGAWTVATALWVAMGLYIGRGQANFWGMPTTGNVLALIGAAFALISLVQGAAQGVPNLISAALTFAYMRGLGPKRVWLRFQSWNLRRQTRSRSKHLRVIGGKNANQSTHGSDRFLH